MALFTSLLRLRSDRQERLEDFTTEIIASVFQAHQDILCDWLTGLGLYWEPSTMPTIQTQVTYRSLSGHTTDRRPDMVIILTHSRRRDLIFIEAKVDSGAGLDQLEDYAEHLENQGGYDVKALVYLTKQYDPQNSTAVLRKCSPASRIIFHQQQWHQLYGVLKKYYKQPLVAEALRFMEEQKINTGNRFSPTDMMAIAGFSHARSLMDAALWGEVRRRFNRVAGAPQRKSATLTHYVWGDRYTIFNDNRGWMVEVGFFMESWRASEYPNVGMAIRLVLKNNGAEAMQKILKENAPDQDGWDIQERRHYGGSLYFYHIRPIAEILNEKDHVIALTEHFLKMLEHVEKLRTISEQEGLAHFWLPRVTDIKAIDQEQEEEESVA